MIPKYRAWDIHGQKMFANDELIIWNSNVYANDGKKLSCNYLKGWSIDDKYLMQSTGLCDKNGKEIFEGDILYGYAGEDFWEIVEFDTEEGKWIRKDIWYNSKLGLSENNEFMEIVGNIYENPELLEYKGE